MPAQIRLTSDQLADLSVLRDAPLEAWEAIVNEVRGLEPHPLHAEKLRQRLLNAAPNSESLVNALARQSLSLLGMMLQLKLGCDEVFEGIRVGLQQASQPWDEHQIRAWSEREELLRSILGSEAVVGTAKALDLSYEHAQLLRRARVLTDIRPIFDQGAQVIQGVVVGHMLRLRYDDLDGEHSMSLAVDETDLKNIIEECQRALKKSAVVQTEMMKAKVPALIPGSDA